MESELGNILRHWRSVRKLSQLELGLRANVSARHINFIERGRAKPSREMIGLLARTLQIPKAQSNLASLAAGYAPIYKDHAASPDLAPLKRSIEITLAKHMPYPGIVLDSEWSMTSANPAALAFLARAGFSEFDNLIEALTAQSPSQSTIDNWHETVALVLSRLQAELSLIGFEGRLAQRYADLQAHFHDHGGRDVTVDFGQAVIPTRFRIDGQVISVFSTVSRFGSVYDLTLADLQVELMFPSDDASAAFFAQTDHGSDVTE